MTDREKEINMPAVPKALFEAALNDESWTWVGLSELLYTKLNKSDYKELLYHLENQLEDDENKINESNII